MADENQNDQSQQGENKADDGLKNLKAEFSRKQENTMKELESIKNMLGTISQSVQQKQQQVIKQEESEIPDPILDPKAYKEYIKKEVLQETSNVVNQNNQRQSQLAALVQSYPELQDGNSELTKKAVDYYNRLSNEEKMSPNAYKFAVQDAAADLGVLAMNKRKQIDSDSEDFTVDSSNFQGGKSRPSKKAQSDKLDDATLAFAEALGRPVNDPKYIESLKKYSGRKNWNKGS